MTLKDKHFYTSMRIQCTGKDLVKYSSIRKIRSEILLTMTLRRFGTKFTQYDPITRLCHVVHDKFINT